MRSWKPGNDEKIICRYCEHFTPIMDGGECEYLNLGNPLAVDCGDFNLKITANTVFKGENPKGFHQLGERSAREVLRADALRKRGI